MPNGHRSSPTGLRVALIQDVLHPNSIGIVRGLEARGHTVLPIVQRPGSWRASTREGSVVTTRVPYGPLSLRRWSGRPLPLRGMPRVRELVRTLREFRPDVVIGRDVRPTSLVSFAVARSIGATPVLLLTKPKLRLDRRLSREVVHPLLPVRVFHTGYVGPVGAVAPVRGSRRTSTALPFPAPFDRPRTAASEDAPLASADAPRERVRLLAVGSFGNAVKRFDWIPAAIHAAGLQDEVDVTYVGQGDERSPLLTAVRACEASLGLRPGRVAFNLPIEEVQERIREADLLVHPSLKETYGSVLVEAMANGVPVLCSDRCGAGVHLDDGVNGLIFRSDSPEHFATQLARAVRDHDLRRRMARAAGEYAQQHLTPDAWARAFERFIGFVPVDRTDGPGA